MKNYKLSLGLLLTNLFIAFLGIGLVIPVMPTIMNELHINGAMVGYLVAAFALTQLLFSPVAGKWVDTIGRKKMIVVGLFVFSFSELLFGLGKSVNILFISRLLGGISAAFIMPAVTAFIADITTMENRAKALGYMSAAISTGFIVGPGIGGFLAEFGTRVPFFAAAMLAAVAGTLSILTLKEPVRNEPEEYITEHVSGFRKVFNPLYFIAFMIIFISQFGLAAFDAIFSLFFDHKFAFTPKDIAIIITGAATVGAISQVVLFDKFVKWLGEIKLTVFCMVFSMIFVVAITMVHQYWMILAVTIFVFMGFDLLRPAVTSYLSKVAKNEQGYVSGMNSMFTSLGNIFGPIIGGYLFDVNLDYPYYFAALFMVIGIALSYFWKAPLDFELPKFQFKLRRKAFKH